MSLLPEDNERLELVLLYGFGFFVVVVYALLAMVIGLGHVEEKTSFGLEHVMEALKPIGYIWAGFAFGKRFGERKPPQ